MVAFHARFEFDLSLVVAALIVAAFHLTVTFGHLEVLARLLSLRHHLVDLFDYASVKDAVKDVLRCCLSFML